MLPSDRVSDHEKCGSLEQQHLISVKDTGEVAEATLQLGDVGDQQVNDIGPGL